MIWAFDFFMILFILIYPYYLPSQEQQRVEPLKVYFFTHCSSCPSSAWPSRRLTVLSLKLNRMRDRRARIFL